jgi:hypothetical protein
MAEKLDTNDARPSVLIAKVNELIDELNDLKMHYHESRDTHFNTTFPKYDLSKESD